MQKIWGGFSFTLVKIFQLIPKVNTSIGFDVKCLNLIYKKTSQPSEKFIVFFENIKTKIFWKNLFNKQN